MLKILAATAAFALMSAGTLLPTSAKSDQNCGTLSPPNQTSSAQGANTATGAAGSTPCELSGVGRQTSNGPGVSGNDTQRAPNVSGGPIDPEKK
jgi:hypothetical protein